MCLKWHAELIDKIYDQVAPASDNHIAMVVREPVGVVGLVLPWNFPLLMLAWKIGPALAAGCSVVVKPAAETSLTALRLAELAVEAGPAGGVLNVVTGSGPRWASRSAGTRTWTWCPSPARPRPGGASCTTRPTATSRRSCWRWAARTLHRPGRRRGSGCGRRTCGARARSGIWVRTARPPRA